MAYLIVLQGLCLWPCQPGLHPIWGVWALCWVQQVSQPFALPSLMHSFFVLQLVTLQLQMSHYPSVNRISISRSQAGRKKTVEGRKIALFFNQRERKELQVLFLCLIGQNESHVHPLQKRGLQKQVRIVTIGPIWCIHFEESIHSYHNE